MHKLINVNILLLDASRIQSDEALDVGLYYHLLKSGEVISIRKADVFKITYDSKEETSDNTAFTKAKDASCITGECK